MVLDRIPLWLLPPDHQSPSQTRNPPSRIVQQTNHKQRIRIGQTILYRIGYFDKGMHYTPWFVRHVDILDSRITRCSDNKGPL